MRWALAWVFFAAGDLVSRLPAYPYWLYSWLMLRSSDIQGDGSGPWIDVDFGDA